MFRVRVGYCPYPVTVYVRGPIKGYISPYYSYYPAVTEWGQYPSLGLSPRNDGRLTFCVLGLQVLGFMGLGIWDVGFEGSRVLRCF